MPTCAAPDCDNVPPAPKRKGAKPRKWCSGRCQARTFYRERHPNWGRKYDLPLTPSAKNYLAAFDAWLIDPTRDNAGRRATALADLIDGNRRAPSLDADRDD